MTLKPGTIFGGCLILGVIGFVLASKLLEMPLTDGEIHIVFAFLAVGALLIAPDDVKYLGGKIIDHLPSFRKNGGGGV